MIKNLRLTGRKCYEFHKDRVAKDMREIVDYVLDKYKEYNLYDIMDRKFKKILGIR
ncbi:MAG: hypothetical protein QXW86_12940 [Saccharolobus sp.]|uniref:hypothetical protein n=1 Tax=Saccharolobus TaxID=2100760 RepID=UPI001F10AE08|nr:hypothetical protein [Saccharolobus shibatae]MCH4816817.1 hypothetical protein [Saccharolobus shibatae]